MDIQQLKQLKILLIGDSCTDVYNYGICERISPEAPVPVLKTLKRENKPGMAKNVKTNLEGFGHQVLLLTNEEQIVKERFVDQRTMQHLLRVDSGENAKVKPLQYEQVENLEFEYDCIVISDYNKGFISDKHCADILKKINKKNMLVFVDSK